VLLLSQTKLQRQNTLQHNQQQQLVIQQQVLISHLQERVQQQQSLLESNGDAMQTIEAQRAELQHAHQEV
jgi:hypothetical protein